MRLDLTQILANPGAEQSFYGEIYIGDDKAGGEIAFEGPAVFEGTVSNNAGVIFLKGRISAAVKAKCARCMAPVLMDFKLDISHILTREIRDLDDEMLPIEQDNSFDADDLVFQSIVLNLPMRFLCSDDCKGICPRCGANLNTEECRCGKQVDPRLEALKKFFNEEE